MQRSADSDVQEHHSQRSPTSQLRSSVVRAHANHRRGLMTPGQLIDCRMLSVRHHMHTLTSAHAHYYDWRSIRTAGGVR